MSGNEESFSDKVARLQREIAERQSELAGLVLGDPRISVSAPHQAIDNWAGLQNSLPPPHHYDCVGVAQLKAAGWRECPHTIGMLCSNPACRAACVADIDARFSKLGDSPD